MSAGEGQSDATHHSDLSGSAADVVQARDITGGIHFHGSGQEPSPVPAQLPADIRGFVNRIADLERMDSVLSQDVERPGSTSVCVIAGTAGVGKTSLAIRWAHRARNRFPDGNLYVNLRGYDPGEPVTASQALERFLTALGVPATALPVQIEDRTALFRTLLANRRILVVLDNAAAVGQVRPLLPGAGQCLVLVTSRSRLSGLLTRDGAHRVTLEVFDEPEAVQLLQETVADYRSGDDEDEIAELARLCARLPLALRIAAERAAARPRMPMSELIENLRDESHLWNALSAEDDDEADAVRTVFAWSYRALPQDAARMFRLLGLHPGPDFSLHAAAAIAAVTPAEARRLLDVLVGAHLLGQVGSNRFQFHDLLRAYASDQVRHLDIEEEQTAVLRRVLHWYLHTAAACVAALAFVSPEVRQVPLEPPEAKVVPRTFESSAEALDWFKTERANLAAAVNTALDVGLNELGWQIPAVLRGIYTQFQLFDDWFAITLRGLVAAERQVNASGQAFLLESLLMASRQSYRLEDAPGYGQALLQIHLDAGDHYGEAFTHTVLGMTCSDSHQIAQARYHFAYAEALCRENGYQVLLAGVLSDIILTSVEAGDLDGLDGILTEALEVARASGNGTIHCEIWLHMTGLATARGQLEQAAQYAEKGLAAAQELGIDSFEAYALLYYAPVQRLRGDPQAALVSSHRAAQIRRRDGRREHEAMALDEAGNAYRALGRLEEAAAFHRQALGIFREIDSPWREAVTLDRLAQVLQLSERSADQVVPLWHEALTLLERFDDTAAQRLRASITAALAQFAPSAEKLFD